MKRPYVICHILSSLDGKISGPFMGAESVGSLAGEYGAYRGRAEAHVIEVLTEETSAAYKTYLRKKGVSYIIAGKKDLDCRTAMEKLCRLFHIETLMICGGGPVEFSLESVEQFQNGGLHIRYMAKNAEKRG